METIFKHDSDTLSESIGISRKRAEEINQVVKRAFLDNDNLSRTVEQTLNEGLDVIETMYAGILIGGIREANRNPDPDRIGGATMIIGGKEVDLSGEQARELIRLLKKLKGDD